VCTAPEQSRAVTVSHCSREWARQGHRDIKKYAGHRSSLSTACPRLPAPKKREVVCCGYSSQPAVREKAFKQGTSPTYSVDRNMFD